MQLYLIYFDCLRPASVGANEAALIAMTVNLGATPPKSCGRRRAIPRRRSRRERRSACRGCRSFATSSLVPALETVYPALTSQFTLIMLAPSVVGTISANELSSMASLVDP